MKEKERKVDKGKRKKKKKKKREHEKRGEKRGQGRKRAKQTRALWGTGRRRQATGLGWDGRPGGLWGGMGGRAKYYVLTSEVYVSSVPKMAREEEAKKKTTHLGQSCRKQRKTRRSPEGKEKKQTATETNRNTV